MPRGNEDNAGCGESGIAMDSATKKDPVQLQQKPREIIIIKRPAKRRHEHHGGAWKVAYADFVTAMMALLIVLWLMNTDDSVRKAVSSFFNSPSGPGKLTGTAAAGQGNSIQVQKQDMGKLREKNPAGADEDTQFPEFEGPCRDHGHV